MGDTAPRDSGDAPAHETRFMPLDHPLGDRINVRGGGGKTTLARAISTRQGVPFIELDDIHWLPDFHELDEDNFRTATTEAINDAGSRWVVDGNYMMKPGDNVMKRTDMVVWLNLPWRVVLWRILKRSVARAWTKETIGGGNQETWRQFFSLEALWWETIVGRKRIIGRGDRFLPLVPAGIPVIEIKTPQELERFYRNHGLTR